MKKSIMVFLTALLCIVKISTSCAAGFSQNADAIEETTKSVLKLVLMDESNGESYYTGSGFIAFNSHTLITNYHVIKDTTIAIASDDDDNIFDIDYVLCADKEADIAILEISGPKNLKPLELYPDNQLKRGSSVVTIGSPEGLKNSVSTGIISYQYVDDKNIPVIQITAPISHGSSGGALLNDDGKVIGVTTSSISSGQNLNFAINIAVAVAMYNAWDGTRYTLANHKQTAKMDYTNIYQYNESYDADGKENTPSTSSTEDWTCPNCGKENTSKYCKECGTEKPFWICSCGSVNSSNKYCGECGRSIIDFIDAINRAAENVKQNNNTGAAAILKELGQFNSGSFDTVVGNHIEAQVYLSKIYYDEGIASLRDGDYTQAVVCFQNAGVYQDAQTMVFRAYYEEADSLLKEKKYKEAISAFEKAKDYSDSKDRIKNIYYTQAEEALENGTIDVAIDLFAKAGDYKDSANRIVQIKEEQQEKKYQSAIEAFDNGDYERAVKLFSQLIDYKESDTMITTAKVGIIQQQLKGINSDPETMVLDDWNQLILLLKQLAEYEENKGARGLEKQIHYFLARYLQYQQFYSEAIEHYQQAEDYSDAIEQISNCKLLKLEQLTAEGKTQEAITYYHSDLEPEGKGYDCVLIKPGSQGCYVKVLLSLIKPLGITKEKVDIENYCEEYQSYVQTIEQYLGMNADGLITIGEYFQIENVIYPGCNSDYVAKLLEKLADLSFVSALPEAHSEYKNNYAAAIKKAETALGLNSDGIITQSEYRKIMDQFVEAPMAVQNLKTTVKNDSVILIWSKVRGAVFYEIKEYGVDGIISEYKTSKSNWTDKDVTTGTKHTYSVIAHKYTVPSEPVTEVVEVPVYYKRVTISELNKNLGKYIGRHVEIINAKYDRYRLKDGKGSSLPFYSHMPVIKAKYELGILCKDSMGLVEFRFEDLLSWNWENNVDIVELCYRQKMLSFSGRGIVVNETADWRDETTEANGLITHFYYKYTQKVPLIYLESVSWRTK